MSGTSAAACVSNRHTGRRWNQWNLFPRNSWSIRKILILNSNQEICLLHRFYGYEVLALFLKCGRKGSTHGGKISVTPPTNPKTLTDVNASRVPELGCGWKNLKLRACSNFDVGVVCHIINISPTGRMYMKRRLSLFKMNCWLPSHVTERVIDLHAVNSGAFSPKRVTFPDASDTRYLSSVLNSVA